MRRVRSVIPFASGILAALTAVWLYTILFPAPHVMSKREVSDTVSQVLASATPPPAFSAEVYRIVQPSLVLITTHAGGDQELGSGRAARGRGHDAGAALAPAALA